MNRKKKFKEIQDVRRKYRTFIRKTRSRKKIKNQSNKSRFKIINHYVKSENKLLTHIVPKKFHDLYELIHEKPVDPNVKIPRHFSLCSDYEDSMTAISNFATAIYSNLGKTITLDFTECEKADTAALFLLQIIRLEFLEKLKKIQRNLNYLNIIPEFRITSPKRKDVLRILFITGFNFNIKSTDLQKLQDDTKLAPLNMMGFLKGSTSQKHYLENKKSIYTQKVVEYLNSCLEQFGYNLDGTAKNSLEGIISEVLSNAEDHGDYNTWFMTANLSKEIFNDNDSSSVGELNLTILNFGDSMFKAFEKTKTENIDLYNKVENYANNILKKINSRSIFKEQLFTLAMMQDQISRLKYKEESRGTGTMNFIKSFLELGDFEDHNKGYYPNLSIFSGKTQLICDNQFKPFMKEGVYCLSLNGQNDLSFPPEASHLKSKKISFPGTLISVKLYISKEHLDNKYGGTQNENN